MDEQRAGRQLHRYRSRIATLKGALERIERAAGDALCSISDASTAGRTARTALDRIGQMANTAVQRDTKRAIGTPSATKEPGK